MVGPGSEPHGPYSRAQVDFRKKNICAICMFCVLEETMLCWTSSSSGPWNISRSLSLLSVLRTPRVFSSHLKCDVVAEAAVATWRLSWRDLGDVSPGTTELLSWQQQHLVAFKLYIWNKSTWICLLVICCHLQASASPKQHFHGVHCTFSLRAEEEADSIPVVPNVGHMPHRGAIWF